MIKLSKKATIWQNPRTGEVAAGSVCVCVGGALLIWQKTHNIWVIRAVVPCWSLTFQYLAPLFSVAKTHKCSTDSTWFHVPNILLCKCPAWFRKQWAHFQITHWERSDKTSCALERACNRLQRFPLDMLLSRWRLSWCNTRQWIRHFLPRHLTINHAVGRGLFDNWRCN